MDDSRFAYARLFFRKPHAAAARLPLRSRRLRVVGSAAASAVLVVGVAAGCGSGGGGGGSSASSPATICEVRATSGPFAQLGVDDELGATAWAAMVNKAGGVLGHKVTLVQENDPPHPATAAALVHKCVTQVHANFIFGPEETSTSSAAIPVANQLQEVLLGWQSGWTGQGISNANLTSYSFPGIGNVFFADDLATITQLIVPRHYTRVAAVGGAPAMQDFSPIGTPENVLSAIPSTSATAAGLADTKAHIAAMKADGLGSANDLSGGGGGWDPGRGRGGRT